MMESPRLPYYDHVPIVLLMLAFVMSAAYSMYYGVGSWTHNRTVNWSWFSDSRQRLYTQLVITSLPVWAAIFYFHGIFLVAKMSLYSPVF